MLGQRLTELRKSLKLTQDEIAKKLHMTRSTYAQYEVDRRVPEYATLEKLADFFGVSIDYLVGRDMKKVALKEEETKYSVKKNVNEMIIKDIVEKYNVDLTVEGNREKLEKIIQIVVSDFERNSQ